MKHLIVLAIIGILITLVYLLQAAGFIIFCLVLGLFAYVRYVGGVLAKLIIDSTTQLAKNQEKIHKAIKSLEYDKRG